LESAKDRALTLARMIARVVVYSRGCNWDFLLMRPPEDFPGKPKIGVGVIWERIGTG
jgi:hypothetical protein